MKLKYKNLIFCIIQISGIIFSPIYAQLNDEFEKLERAKKIVFDRSFLYKCNEVFVGVYSKEGAEDQWKGIVLDKKLNFISINDAALILKEQKEKKYQH